MARKHLAAGTILLAAASSHAETFYFTYQSSRAGLSGSLQGVLQADNNTVLVAAVDDFVLVNGATASALPFVTTTGATFGEPNGLPFVTFNGAKMNLFACNIAICQDGFDLDTTGVYVSTPVFLAGPAFGKTQEAYRASGWTLSTVPEPTSWSLLVTGFGLAGTATRRRRFRSPA